MKEWKIIVSHNEWEYERHVIIKANKIERVGDNNRTILADGVEIEFDEEIEDPKLNNKKMYIYFYNKTPISKDNFVKKVPENWESEVIDSKYSYGYFTAIEIDNFN